ncbi:hypothetical protein C8R44DRAFT_885973 [Mycena epipterygia]|nr:hypothetical protein C8R44DRAFT_885973 [Mycena epipterygia]
MFIIIASILARNTRAFECPNGSTFQCCKTLIPPAELITILSLLGISAADVTGEVGDTCSPAVFGPVCSGPIVCCTGPVIDNGPFSLGCVSPI